MKLRTAFLSSLILAALPASAAFADPVTYVYTGNPYNSFEYNGPYKTSDHLTITLTFSSPLPPNLEDSGSYIPIDFSVADGVYTAAQLDPAVYLHDDIFSTDGEGNILTWGIDLFPDELFGPQILSYGEIPRTYSADESAVDGWLVITDGNPGTWTVASLSSSATPEPSALLLLTTGALAGAGALYRRRTLS